MTAFKCDKCGGWIYIDGIDLSCFNCGKVFYHGKLNGVFVFPVLVSKEYKRHNYGAILYKNNEKEYLRVYRLRHKAKLREYQKRYRMEALRSEILK